MHLEPERGDGGNQEVVVDVVEDVGRSHGSSAAFVDRLRKMAERTNAAAGDDRYVDRRGNQLDKFNVVALPRPVAVDGVKEDLAGA